MQFSFLLVGASALNSLRPQTFLIQQIQYFFKVFHFSLLVFLKKLLYEGAAHEFPASSNPPKERFIALTVVVVPPGSNGIASYKFVAVLALDIDLVRIANLSIKDILQVLRLAFLTLLRM